MSSKAVAKMVMTVVARVVKTARRSAFQDQLQAPTSYGVCPTCTDPERPRPSDLLANVQNNRRLSREKQSPNQNLMKSLPRSHGPSISWPWW